MVKDCIILAGGLGTRLRSVVNEVPKVMAPVNDLPFLHYLLEQLSSQGIINITIASGYKHEIIEEWMREQDKGFHFQFSVEDEPLGTGGAIRKALHKTASDEVLILNGDSFCKINYEEFSDFHRSHGATATIALKHMVEFDRYGCVEMDTSYRIKAFLEKEYRQEGLINTGVYLINKKQFLALPFPEKFSIEKEFLEAFVNKIPMYGFRTEGYFIDIGIPEDYGRAQLDFKNFKQQILS